MLDHCKLSKPRALREVRRIASSAAGPEEWGGRRRCGGWVDEAVGVDGGDGQPETSRDCGGHSSGPPQMGRHFCARVPSRLGQCSRNIAAIQRDRRCVRPSRTVNPEVSRTDKQALR